MKTGEIRSCRSAIPQVEDTHVSGLAAVFYSPHIAGSAFRFKMETSKGDLIEVEERVMPSAFNRAIREDDVMCLYNHQRMLGRRTPNFDRNTLELSVVDAGLNYRCLLLPSQVELRENLAASNIRGSSFQFLPKDTRWKKEGELRIRELHDVELIDVAPVDRPAYAATSANLRSEERAEFEKLVAEVDQVDSLETAEQRALEVMARWQSRARALKLRNESRAELSHGDLSYVLARLVWRATEWAANNIEVYRDYVIYETGENPCQHWKQSYTVAADGTVSLVGQPVQVEEQYVPVGA